jgi:multiple sugar transport system permease protein
LLYKNNGKNVLGRTVVRTLTVIFLLIFAVATLFPICYMFASAFGPPIESAAVEYTIVPRSLTLNSFKFFLNYSPYSLRWILNSLIVSGSATISNVLFTGMAGYAFARIKFPGRKTLFWVLLCTMMVPYQVVQVPLYILVVNILKMPNSYGALIFPGLATIYNIFLMKQFLSSIPYEIIEAAKIDGCSQGRLYFQIIAPLSKTVLSVIAIFTFMESWNTFFWPLLVTRSIDMETIQVGLTNFRFANTTYFSPMMAGAALAALPMFILFFSLQKYFLQGVTVGAIKG